MIMKKRMNSLQYISSSRRMDFTKDNNKAIEEIWYRRAVEQYYVDPQSFIFSVPHDAGRKIADYRSMPKITPNLNYISGDSDASDFLVTASHAIFHNDDKKVAPVAVVGYQFRHSALLTLFKNVTYMVIFYQLKYS